MRKRLGFKSKDVCIDFLSVNSGQGNLTHNYFNFERSMENISTDQVEHLKAAEALRTFDPAQWRSWRQSNHGPILLKDEEFDHLDARDLSLHDVIFLGCKFISASFLNCNLSQASFTNCKFLSTRFESVRMRGARFTDTNFSEVVFSSDGKTQCDLGSARFVGGKLLNVNFSGVVAIRAEFRDVDMISVNWSKALLCNSLIDHCTFSAANFDGANMTESIFARNTVVNSSMVDTQISGILALNNGFDNLSPDRMRCLVQGRNRSFTVQNPETANFVQQVNDGKFSAVVNEMNEKAVLILGRFSEGRRKVLTEIEEGVTSCGYVPIVFDFEGPKYRDLTESIVLLAHLVKFVIADLTAPRSVGNELRAVAPSLAVPVVPLIQITERPFAMFYDLWKYHWVLDLVRYDSLQSLKELLPSKIIMPAELKMQEITKLRNRT